MSLVRGNVGGKFDSSSSVIVTVWADGADTPLPPVTVAETVTVLSGASTVLSTAVIVTVSVLDVEPAAISSVVPLCVTSAATAGESGVAVTVTVTASLDTALNVAVTVLTPPFSAIEAGVSTSVTAGAVSDTSTWTAAEQLLVASDSSATASTHAP